MKSPFLPIEQTLRQEGASFIVGIDEAGRGPLAGPVVVAGVIFPVGKKIAGITDSKKLIPKKRLELFSKIIESALDFAICIVPPQIIDEINILNAVRLGMRQVVSSLHLKPDAILVDGNDKHIGFDQPHQTIIKGDQKVYTIAAASILAKVARDHLMQIYDDIFPQYGFGKHQGYGTILHRKMIEKHGRCPIHRQSFKLKNLTERV